MGLERPTGNVIVNTVWCKYSKVNDKELNNFMRKSSVVDISILYGRGEVDTPVRIRIA